MSSAYVRAIRGPVLLIVLGVLMLADHRSDFSFWRTWPILLVTAGWVLFNLFARKLPEKRHLEALLREYC